MRFLWLVIASFMFLAWPVADSAAAEDLDDLPEVISDYARAKRYLREGRWLEASRAFTELAGHYPNSPNADLFAFNRAKAEMYFGNYDEALAGFSSFINRYPESPCLAHVWYFRSNIYYLKGQLDRAVAGYIQAYGRSSDQRLTDLLEAALSGAIAGAKSVSLGPADFENLDEERKCRLAESLADAMVARGEYRTAQNLLQMCGRTLDVPQSVLDEAGAVGADLELAVVLPFSGEMQAFGEEIYHGAIVAAEEYRAETGRGLNLVPYDTKGDPVNAARIVRQLIGSSADAVIGPLTSEEAAVASATLACGTLPMIAPAATQAGLTMLSESSFQLSPNIELQGVVMAEYAVFNRQADSAAIITPTSPDDLRMARAFAERFEQLGGEVVAIEYYRPRDKDFGDYIEDVKALLLGVHPDSTFFINEYGDTLDADGIPVSIDCLYLPGSSSRLRLLLPQINFYNLNAFYLGSDSWGDDAILRLGDQITKGAVFPSASLEDQRGEAYLRFAAAFDRRYGKQPQRLAALGYDAVKVMTQAVLDGAATRSEIVSHLRKIDGYRGAAASVTFGQHRENVELPLYKIVDGHPTFLGKTESESSGRGDTVE